MINFLNLDQTVKSMNSTSVVVSLSCVSIALLAYVFKPPKSHPKDPPLYKSLPVLGILPEVMKYQSKFRLPDFFAKIKEIGPVILLRSWPRVEIIVVTRADLAKEVLTRSSFARNELFQRLATGIAKYALFVVLFNNQDPSWPGLATSP